MCLLCWRYRVLKSDSWKLCISYWHWFYDFSGLWGVITCQSMWRLTTRVGMGATRQTGRSEVGARRMRMTTVSQRLTPPTVRHPQWPPHPCPHTLCPRPSAYTGWRKISNLRSEIGPPRHHQVRGSWTSTTIIITTTNKNNNWENVSSQKVVSIYDLQIGSIMGTPKFLLNCHQNSFKI